MSKFFFKGTQDKRENYQTQGYTNKSRIKLGSAKNPLTLTVTSEARKTEVEKRLLEHELLGTITVNTDTDASENISELESVLNKPVTMVFDKTPNRNDPCSCGSGKKYKKCCA